MKFECNCKSDKELANLINAMHKADSGFNFEVVARLWHTPADYSKTVMVEFQVATQTCRNITENEDEPDWFTAYEVEGEHDNDCSCEIFTETSDDYISLSGLKAAMEDFAEEVVTRFLSHDAATHTKPVMKAIDIIWDIDVDENIDLLPKEIEIPAGMVDEEEISDYLSDITGFCHKGFHLVVCPKSSLDNQIQSASSHATEFHQHNKASTKMIETVR